MATRGRACGATRTHPGGPLCVCSFPSPRHQVRVRAASDLAASQAVVLVWVCCTTRERMAARGGRVGGREAKAILGVLGCEGPLGRGGAKSASTSLRPGSIEAPNHTTMPASGSWRERWVGKAGVPKRGKTHSSVLSARKGVSCLCQQAVGLGRGPQKRHDKARRGGGERETKPHFYGCSCSGSSRGERVLGAVQCPRDVERTNGHRRAFGPGSGGGFLEPFFVGL